MDERVATLLCPHCHGALHVLASDPNVTVRGTWAEADASAEDTMAALRVRAGDLTAERDAAVGTSTRLAHTLTSLRADVARLTAERDAARAELHARADVLASLDASAARLADALDRTASAAEVARLTREKHALEIELLKRYDDLERAFYRYRLEAQAELRWSICETALARRERDEMARACVDLAAGHWTDELLRICERAIVEASDDE